jgi:outer membrane immunogenic protein
MKQIAIGIAAITVSVMTSASCWAQSIEPQAADDILRRLRAAEAREAAAAKEIAVLHEKLRQLRLSRQSDGSQPRVGDTTAFGQKTAHYDPASDLNLKPALYNTAAATTLVSAAPPIPEPPFRWSGFYVGGNIGYGWGNARSDIAENGTITTFPNFPGSTFVNPPYTFADSNAQRLGGLTGGAQAGYNYQVNPKWVLGLESDIQASGERGKGFTSSDPFAGTLCTVVLQGTPSTCLLTTPLGGTTMTNAQAKIGWFGTLRGRLGVLINDEVLLYGSGGLAYGEVGLSGSVNANASAPGAVGFGATFGPNTAAFSESKMKLGFAAGGGLEGRFSYWLPPSWTWKLEYLYVDLGTLDTVIPFIAASAGLPNFSDLAGTVTIRTRFTDNIVRAGLNYQFH